MNILVINSLYEPNVVGGAEISVKILAEGLADAGNRVTVISTGEHEYCDVNNNVERHYFSPLNLYWIKHAKNKRGLKKILWHVVDSNNVFIDRKIRRFLDKGQYDLIHTNNLSGFSVRIWKIAKELGVPVVHTLRDYYLLCLRSSLFKNKLCVRRCKLCVLSSLFKKHYSSYVSGVVGVSRFILEKHCSEGYFKNVHKTCIYNPVMKSGVSKRAHISGKKVCGFVGRLTVSKGIEYFLERVKLMNLDWLEVHIYGTGSTSDYESWLKKRFESEKILFKGYTDPGEVYRNVDFTVIPSLWNEPLSRVVLESLTENIPVLVSNRGGLPELVDTCPNGFVFDLGKNGDFESKLELMKDFKIDPNNLEDRFSVSGIVKEYMSFFEMVIQGYEKN